MRLRPLHDKVIVKPAKQVERTASGLHLAEHRKPDQVGTVLAMGPHVKTDAKPGDQVLFSWQSGQEVILDDDGTRVLIMNDRDLLTVIGQGIDVVAEEPIV